MNPLESLRLATRALRVNTLRSALTMLGIVVGVAAVDMPLLQASPHWWTLLRKTFRLLRMRLIIPGMRPAYCYCCRPLERSVCRGPLQLKMC